MKLNYGKSEIGIQTFIVVALVFVGIICLYPFLYVLSMSISNPMRIAKETLWLLPKGFSTLAYQKVFESPQVWRSYYNTLWYALIGTTINVALTVTLAYPLSRRDFRMRNFLMFLVTFTMLFSGGLIPRYIVVNKIGIYNTRWALILPTAIAAWNMIIARTFFQGLPDSLAESAKLDGANDITILRRIIIPISQAIIAVLTIFYAVFHWNSFFPALIYLPDGKLHPLQLFLVKLLIQNDTANLEDSIDEAVDKLFVAQQLKYSAIIVSVLPIITIYPFLQKYFVRGVMIGAIKG